MKEHSSGDLSVDHPSWITHPQAEVSPGHASHILLQFSPAVHIQGFRNSSAHAVWDFVINGSYYVPNQFWHALISCLSRVNSNVFLKIYQE